MILRGGGMNEIAGIIVGHAYYFLTVQYPMERGTGPLIKTPSFLYSLFPNTIGGVGGLNQAPRQNDRAARRDGNFWGRGQAVGGN